ncbi:hypothetical protein JAAARDRAFT_178758 [Jaapia argillacea MUCL 33604]|uniref:CS domain-containing protein n=1 Tax=Jaapia argillacea MUCL 33604 TaxID=933084 RepID=A0A067PTJ9_9AGAM|nr:hypothetical protein JAAARDRAFT_178758 [Jaapia argillacea MUCL 33604]
MSVMDSMPYSSYSWHQSHDQATILLLVPYGTADEDVTVIIERNHLVAGVCNQAPLVKGRLYGNVDPVNSMWQLESRASRLSARERTISSTSTASTQSSYAVVSDPEISSSFAASLESAQASDTEDLDNSPALSSPVSSFDERTGFSPPSRPSNRLAAVSRPESPHLRPSLSLTSSLSSLDSLHSPQSGRLLTLHLEKADSVIWPSLIAGPAPESLAPCLSGPPGSDSISELRYNMDPTSLVLIGLDLYDIRKDKDEAFECFVRAWYQARVPSAILRLVTHFVPVQLSLPQPDIPEFPARGTPAYYIQCLGGPSGLAQLYLEAGLLHLEGSASALLSSSYSALSSIRMSNQPLHTSHYGESSTDAWRRDREAAKRCFDRARVLNPDLDVPVLPLEFDDLRTSGVAEASVLRMPSIDVASPRDPISESISEKLEQAGIETVQPRRRRKRESITIMDEPPTADEDEDSAWYLYVPGLVGAGTALLVVGFIGALSLSSWRKNQSS